MAVTFYGNGLCYIPTCHRCIAFVNGEYKTDDGDEIAVLCQAYKHDNIITAHNIDTETDGNDKPKRGRPKNAG
jgi:hypothetical protein